jgi:uncharacterized protein
MTRHATLALWLSLLSPGISSPAMADATRPVTIPGALEFLLPITQGEDYRILVYRPEGVPPPAGWPAIYTLDADRTFAIMAEFVRSQGGTPESTGVLPMVVVGIEAAKDGKTRRARDFTPPSANPAPGEGGAEAFFAFIEATVKPTVERIAPIDPKRQALFGHSYGGLFALHVATAHPNSYAAYAAASPSLWWNGEATMRADLRPLVAAHPKVLITVAEYDQADDPFTDRGAHADVQAKRRMVDNAQAFAARLTEAGLPADAVIFPGETHGSVIPAAIARAVRVISHEFRSSNL